MNFNYMPLSKQIELVFREIREEILSLSSGIVFVQIRNNTIGKFGIKHFPIESKSGMLQPVGRGLSESHLKMFKDMAVESLRHKKHWTHGEILFEFALIKGTLHASVQFESNYNMANLVMKRDSRNIKEIY
ncbi:Uncharacterised protein [Chlamydia abortus]|nr:Uncharacterised protein [Chlamydia abortus]